MASRLLKAFASLVGITLVLVGVPILLVRLVGWPGPDHVPSLAEVRRIVMQRDFGTSFVLATLAITGWVLWAQVLWATVWELVVNGSGISMRRPTRPAPLVAAPIGRIVAIAVMSIMAIMARPTSGVALSSGPLAVSSATSIRASHAASVVFDAGTTTTPDRAVSATDSDAETTSEWVVQPGDTLWDIAEKTLGDGARVDDLVAANRWLDSPDALRAGMTLALPPGANVGVVADAQPSETVAADAAEAASTTASDEVVVQRGDNLWNLTEQRFGATDMERIVAIADANEIRDPDLIYPGDVIDLEPGTSPQDNPVTNDVPESTPDEPSTSPAQSEPGAGTEADVSQPDAAVDAPADLSRHNIEVGRPPREAAPDQPANDAEISTPPPTTTHVILRPPGFDDDGTAPNDDGTLPAPPPGTSPLNALDDQPHVARSAGQTQGPAGVSLTRVGLAAAGILALLAARRRRQLRAHLIPGVSGPEQIDLERQLRATARGPIGEPDDEIGASSGADAGRVLSERVNRIDPIAAVVYGIADHHHASVRYVIDDPDADRTEVIFDSDVELSHPWSGDGNRWSIDWNADPAGGWRTAEVGDVSPSPTLIMLGTDGNERLVYTDLETIRSLEISGPEDDAVAIVSAVGAALASRLDMSSASFVGVDVPAGIFLGHEGYLPADSFVSGLAAVQSALGSTVRQPGPLSRLRLQTGEPWEPAVILVGPRTGRVKPVDLTGAVLVSAAPIHGPSTVLSPDGDAWMLRPGEIRLKPCGISTDELDQIQQLLEKADSGRRPAPSGVLPFGDASPSVPDPNKLGVGDSSEDPQFLVRLFAHGVVNGPDGVDVRFGRASSRELVSWLVTHRDQSTKTGARAALWNFQIRTHAFSNVLSDIRRSLNAVVSLPPGEDWIGHTNTERLPLHPAVTADGDLLRVAIAAAMPLSPTDQIGVLRPVVELIEAAPFADTAYLWPDAEGLVAELSLVGAEAALRLAEAYEAIDDLQGVEFATDRGLRVIPGHEQLTAIRLRAVDAAGSSIAVTETWNQYERALCDGPWAPADASPELMELRRGLSR